MISARTCLICSLCLALWACAQPAQAAGKAMFYFQVQGVRLAKGIDGKVEQQAQKLLHDILEKNPKIVTNLGDKPLAGKELEKQLKAMQLDGYGVILRVTKAQHSLEPPPKGKVFKILMVEVQVAIDAEKIPSGQMALAGEGMAQVGTETRKFNVKERDQLRGEALTDAINQAITKSVTRLSYSYYKTHRHKSHKHRR